MIVNRSSIPRLPLTGSIELSFRCNNRCRHCWIARPEDSPKARRELSTDEIRSLANDARALGCQRWSITGGEPMLRPDFAECFDSLTRRTLPYTLNTNGTLITPAIARLLKRKGLKLVALYGASAAVHDRVTRTPGSHEAVLRGMAYLREAGTGFTVQLVPLKTNVHEWGGMIRLATAFSPHWRVGASWLYMSADGSAARNRSIARERLDPETVTALDPPVVHDMMTDAEDPDSACAHNHAPFFSCLTANRFHVNPYGLLKTCAMIQDPSLVYDLRRGTFREAWESFLPSLPDRVRGRGAFSRQCGRCRKRNDCHWCPAYAYLEHRRHSAPVRYLCQLAGAAHRYQRNWIRHHRRFFDIAGITIQVDAEHPFAQHTFASSLEAFRVDNPGTDLVRFHHQFHLPAFRKWEGERLVYRKKPWRIFRRGDSWAYFCNQPRKPKSRVCQAASFNPDHTRGIICHANADSFRLGRWHSLSGFPSDQIVLARVLADREACFLHAAGMVMRGHGLLFLGHSGAGKSTISRLLNGQARLLNDERMIVRRWPDGFKIHSTWSHGEIATVSPGEAPLRALCFLEQAGRNRLIPIAARADVFRRLLFRVIRPCVSADWWDKTMGLLARLAREVPAYRLQFDRSGRICQAVESLTS
ncbi:MAG: radical SAM protein [Lentisphaerae bacterium]|nr:radical SAM protein [Lentisphaerota bacterium]